MKAQGFCPLCGQRIPKALIQLGQEGGGARHPIVTRIQKAQPGWVEEEGACGNCWESFTAILCVIRFFNQSGNQQRLGDGSTSRAASQAMTNILWLDRGRHSIPIRRSVATAGAR